MGSTVKTIFKTLIMIPVTIFVCFLIMNLFAFVLGYFQLLGLSYSVQQTAIENNYLPSQELNVLYEYAAGLESQFMNNIRISGTDGHVMGVGGPISGSGGNGAMSRKQYGTTVNTGVTASFHFNWPFSVRDSDVGDIKEQIANANGNGANYLQHTVVDSNINIVINVPGLKYYPDMS